MRIRSRCLASFNTLRDIASDTDAADVLGDWCRRHDIEPTLREGQAELGGQMFRLIYLSLRPK